MGSDKRPRRCPPAPVWRRAGLPASAQLFVAPDPTSGSACRGPVPPPRPASVEGSRGPRLGKLHHPRATPFRRATPSLQGCEAGVHRPAPDALRFRPVCQAQCQELQSRVLGGGSRSDFNTSSRRPGDFLGAPSWSLLTQKCVTGCVLPHDTPVIHPEHILPTAQPCPAQPQTGTSHIFDRISFLHCADSALLIFGL